MTTTHRAPALALLLPAALLACAPLAGAQGGDLASRVNAAPGTVQLTFAAREGVCGNGRTYYSPGPGQFNGMITGSLDELLRTDPCVAGPVRVVLTRAGGVVIDVDTYVGPPATEPDARDLGLVGAHEAVDYLLGLAARAEGSPSRRAITAAMLADSARPWSPLLAIARDRDRPLDTRRAAIGYLPRAASASGIDEAQVVSALVAMARDADEREGARTSAVSALARLERGAGVLAVLDLAGASDAWLVKQAVSAVAGSGDPRARTFLRELAAADERPEELRRSAVRGVGRSGSATGEDAEFLRTLYARTATEPLRGEIIGVLGGLGGAENERWLQGVVRDEGTPLALRRKALQQAARDDRMTSASLVALFDATPEPRLRQDVLALLGRRGGERAATDKLLAVARDPADRTLQRYAIARLSQSSDPRVRDALEGMVGGPP